jgi:hypothetical protein
MGISVRLVLQDMDQSLVEVLAGREGRAAQYDSQSLEQDLRLGVVAPN